MFKTEVFKSDESSWDKIKDGVILLEQEAFEDHPFTPEDLEKDFLSKNNIIILLRPEETDETIGFVYAKPIEDAEPNRADEKGETAYIWDAVIKKEYRGQHLLGPLMARLEEELKKAGYSYMDMNAVIANKLAENIEK